MASTSLSGVTLNLICSILKIQSGPRWWQVRVFVSSIGLTLEQRQCKWPETIIGTIQIPWQDVLSYLAKHGHVSSVCKPVTIQKLNEEIHFGRLPICHDFCPIQCIKIGFPHACYDGLLKLSHKFELNSQETFLYVLWLLAKACDQEFLVYAVDVSSCGCESCRQSADAKKEVAWNPTNVEVH